jgi:hypothetical protein
MHLSSALALFFGVPAAIAAVAPRSPSPDLARDQDQGALFKRTPANCFNTKSTNGGWTPIPRDDIYDLIDQINKIQNDRLVPLFHATSWGPHRWTYTWNQAKICIINDNWGLQNTHLNLGEAAWVVSFIAGQCTGE